MEKWLDFMDSKLGFYILGNIQGFIICVLCFILGVIV